MNVPAMVTVVVMEMTAWLHKQQRRSYQLVDMGMFKYMYFMCVYMYKHT